MNTMTLLGSEDVARASYTMREAAADMCRAASNIEEAVRQQRINNDVFLDRLEDILKNHETQRQNKI